MELFPGTRRMGMFNTNLERTTSVDPEDVITIVHADSEKNSELAVEVSSWRSGRAQRVPGRGLARARRATMRGNKRRAHFRYELYACARVLRMQEREVSGDL